MRQRPWQEDDVKRILIDPFSSFLVAPALVEVHELAVSTEEWLNMFLDILRRHSQRY